MANDNAPNVELDGNTLVIRDTKFIFNTNFAGNPEADRFGSDKRRGNIIIPDPEVVAELLTRGFNVKATKPRPSDDPEAFMPDYYISATLNFDSEWPPEVYLVSGNSQPVPLDASSVGIVDKAYIKRVRVALNLYESKKTGVKSVYIKVMYVEQDVAGDPFAHIYANRGGEGVLPF